jgi:hypothetical protein
LSHSHELGSDVYLNEAKVLPTSNHKIQMVHRDAIGKSLLALSWDMENLICPGLRWQRERTKSAYLLSFLPWEGPITRLQNNKYSWILPINMLRRLIEDILASWSDESFSNCARSVLFVFFFLSFFSIPFNGHIKSTLVLAYLFDYWNAAS